MNNYIKEMKWAVVHMVDRNTQDYHKSKVSVDALFHSPVQAEENYIVSNNEIKRYILRVDDLEEFEKIYNLFQDLREQYGDRAIFHIKDIGLNCDTENKYRNMLGIYTSIDF